MSRALRVVGVLGGMGPAATLDFQAKLLAAEGAARTDQDHVRLIIDCNPGVPDRNAAVAGTGPSPGPVLARMARGLEIAGAEALVMTCNTAHAFAAEIEAAVAIPLLSLIDAAVDAALTQRPGLRRVGVLAANGCLDAGLYQRALAVRSVQAIVPEHDARAGFMDLLYRIKGGDLGSDVRAGMRAAADGLVERGAEVVIAGCTEAPLVLRDGETSAPLIDSTQALVARALAFARGEG